MIESRLLRSGRITIPAAIREALGLKPGDMLRYEIDGDKVRLSRGGEEVDELFTDEELRPIIDRAAEDTGETFSSEEVFAELHARIDAVGRRRDAA